MPSEYLTETGLLTPENKGGPRVGIGARAYLTRVGDGAISMQLLRGDGLTFPVEVRCVQQSFDDGVESLMTIAGMDLTLPDFYDVAFRLRIVADGGAELTVRDALISTEPSAAPGL